MTRRHAVLLAGAILLLGLVATPRVAAAQKAGGVMKVYFFDSPATMSIHEESTIAGQGPMMGVFNNLVMYDPDVPQSGLKSIVPDLATSWSWDEARTQLSFKLRPGVRWHDGKPFTARDVKCTFDLLQGQPINGETLRVNPRKAWYGNLAEVVGQGRRRGRVPAEAAAARLHRAARLGLHADLSLPCRAGRDAATADRHRAVPLRRVQAQRDRSGSRATRTTGRRTGPYLDGIEWKIMKNSSTGMLSFVAGTVDMTSPYFLQVPVLNDIRAQAPQRYAS